LRSLRRQTVFLIERFGYKEQPEIEST